MSLNEPLSVPAARKLIKDILRDGSVNFSRHALKEMKNDKLDELDITNVVRGGAVQPGEWEMGSWRYQVRTSRMVAVVAFRSESMLVVVTAWRLT